MTDHIAVVVAEFAGGLPAGTRVLDVGCGLRPYEPLFAQQRYEGIDVPTSGRESEDKHPDAWFDGVDIPYEDATFGAALCTQVLEHAQRPDALLAEVRRVLGPEGLLLITVPFVWGEHEVPYDFRRFSSFGVRQLVEGAGLEVVEQRRLQPGVATVEQLVNAELTNDDRLVPPDGFADRLQRQLARRLWFVQLRLFRRLYRFERLFLDNMVVARRPADG